MIRARLRGEQREKREKKNREEMQIKSRILVARYRCFPSFILQIYALISQSGRNFSGNATIPTCKRGNARSTNFWRVFYGNLILEKSSG